MECSHVTGRCQLEAPCCRAIFKCRLCHDEVSDHKLDVKQVTSVVCSECLARDGSAAGQPVSETCNKCKVKFGNYFCAECRIFDDEDHDQYHCDLCGFCVSGGRENNFHCNTCNLCLPIDLQNNHKCLDKGACTVCMDSIHTGQMQVMALRCGHVIHFSCLEQLVAMGQFTCPVCVHSLSGMTGAWAQMDAELVRLPMGAEFENTTVGIICRDCHVTSTVQYHDLGHKCDSCGSYNTYKTTAPVNYPQQVVQEDDLGYTQ